MTQSWPSARRQVLELLTEELHMARRALHKANPKELGYWDVAARVYRLRTALGLLRQEWALGKSPSSRQ